MDFDAYLRVLAALVFVLALIGLIAWAVRRFGLAGALPRLAGGRRRLALVEALPVDAKRRLVLLSRDGVEHLVLLGAASETVVETGITPPPDGPGAPPDAPQTDGGAP